MKLIDFYVLDHDEFGLSQSKLINVIDSNILEWDSCEKPVPTFSHPALERGYREEPVSTSSHPDLMTFLT